MTEEKGLKDRVRGALLKQFMTMSSPLENFESMEQASRLLESDLAVIKEESTLKPPSPQQPATTGRQTPVPPDTREQKKRPLVVKRGGAPKLVNRTSD